MTAFEGQPDFTQTQALIRAAENGDRGAYERLHATNRQWMQASAVLQIGQALQRVDVDDLLQEVWIDVCRRIESGKLRLDGTEGAFRRYVTRIIRNKAKDMARKSKSNGTRVESLRSSVLDLCEAAGLATPSQEARGGELLEGLETVLDELSEHDREILDLRINCKMSFEEIMPRLHILKNGEPVVDDLNRPQSVTKISTVKARFHRARGNLEAALRRRGFGE